VKNFRVEPLPLGSFSVLDRWSAKRKKMLHYSRGSSVERYLDAQERRIHLGQVLRSAFGPAHVIDLAPIEVPPALFRTVLAYKQDIRR
jgi:hypothetical protein